MIRYDLDQKKVPILIIIILLCFGLLIIVPMNPTIQTILAASSWNQTSERDFYNGTFNNTVMIDKGVNSELQIDLSGLNEWYQVMPVTKPSARYGHAMAPIWGTDKAVTYGGAVRWGYEFNNTWVYDLSDNTWIEKITPEKPSARGYHTMASIYGTDKVILFGGMRSSIENNETWEYDLSNNTWTRIYPITSPPARTYHAMAAIPGDDKIVLFGGEDYIGYNLNDTWVYDLSKNTWTQQNPVNRPSIRTFHKMATISGDDKVVLFGGTYVTNYKDDTWVYDLSDNTWTQQITNNKPSPRYRHAMTTIPGTDKIFLFGGFDNYLRNDSWVYDLSDNTWTENSMTTELTSSCDHDMVTIWGTEKVVLFGGYRDVLDWSNDTWIYQFFLSPENGTYVSIPYDTCSNSSFKTINWYAISPVNTSIKFQLRTAPTKEYLLLNDFVGPEGKTSTFYTTSQNVIWPGHDGDRWIQYKAFLNISIATESPILKDITISYNCLPNVTVHSPLHESILSNNRPKFIWNFNDFDSEHQAAFQVLISNNRTFNNITYDSSEQTTSDEYWDFPIGTKYSKLPDGIWYWKVRTKDPDDAWTEFSSIHEFTIDTTAPNSIITMPINDGYYRELTTLSGIAIDGVLGSGIKKVEITIKRLSDNNFWTGTAWVSLTTWLNTTGGTEWTYDSSSVKWTSGGRYIIQSRSTDNNSNVELPGTGNVFSIDKESPISTIEIPKDNVWLNKFDIISGISIDPGGAGIKKVEISIFCTKDNNPWDGSNENNTYWSGTTWTSNENWLPVKGTAQWLVDTSDIPWSSGNHYLIRSRAVDILDNMEVVDSGKTIMFDNQPPEMLDIFINKGDEYTSATIVTLSLNANDIDSGISQMSFCSDGSDWSSWESYTTERNFTLPLIDGEKNVYFRVQDNVGNIAEPIFDTIVLDTTPPEELNIVIEENVMYTNKNHVKLDLYAIDDGSGLNRMSFSYNGIDWLTWESFRNIKQISLLPGDGEQTIFFRVTDKLDNIAKPVFDNIILDTTPPHSLSIKINNGAYETNSTLVTLQLNALDNISGLGEISLSSDGETWSAWENFTWIKSYNLTPGDGTKTVYFRVKDCLGNMAEPVSTTILLKSTTIRSSQPSKKTTSWIDFWYFILIVIVIILLLIVVGLVMILKHKKVPPQKLLTAGTVPTGPEVLLKPSTSAAQVATTVKVSELPGTATVTATIEELPKPLATPAPIPQLAKSTQTTSPSPIQPTSSQATQAPKDLPQLPPATSINEAVKTNSQEPKE